MHTIQSRVVDGLRGQAASLPFSFVYGNRSSAECLAAWPHGVDSNRIDDGRVRHMRTWTDPRSGLRVICEGIEYADWAAVEWIVHFENVGKDDTLVLEGLKSIDLATDAGSEGPVLHHAKGSAGEFGDYQPLATPIQPGQTVNLHSHGWHTCTSGDEPSGSPSVESMPFFNLQTGSEGLIAALGWTGPWTAEFARVSEGGVRIRDGMDGLHLKLRPGEKIRSPRVLMLFWSGDRIDAHNRWRRLLLEYYSPRPGGRPFEGLIAHCVWGNWMNAAGHIADMEWYVQNDLPVDCYWMDAKWCGEADGEWAAHQSDRKPNPDLFPDGIRPVSDAARQHGMKFLLWFVPNSVYPGVDIARDHPEWVGEPFSDKIFGDQVFYGLDHGDPEVNAFMIDYYARIIAEYGIDVFRVDGTHIWPRSSDPDRLGMKQIRYNEGFYAFWDGLLERDPDLLIDNCGCGGRKLDLETIKRSAILWRSDSQASHEFDPASSQGMTYGLSLWLPLHAAAVPLSARFGPYALRSGYAPAMVLTWAGGKPADVRERIDVDVFRRILREYLAVRRCFTGDYYPLTPYSLDADRWLAWQFDRPDLGEGVVQAFRREQCREETLRCRLRGLTAEADYDVTDPDTGTVTRMSGGDLMIEGVQVALKECPAAGIIRYKKAD